MDGLQRLLIERACEGLIYEYARRVDLGEAAQIADLFTEDGLWRGEITLTGRGEIRDWFTQRGQLTRRVSRHVCTNVAVRVRSDNEAESLCYMVNYRHDRQEGDQSLPVPADVPKYVGELHDHFRLTPEGWRFSSRRVVLSFLRHPTRNRQAVI